MADVNRSGRKSGSKKGEVKHPKVAKPNSKNKEGNMALAHEIVDWVERYINMTQFIHPMWHKKLREWGFKELGNHIDT